MTGSVALVTGATSGIGHLTAGLLATRDPRRLVLVHGRTEARAKKAVARLRARLGVDNLEPVAADLGSLASLDDLVSRLARRSEGPDLLVLAAGVQLPHDRGRSAEGIELTFAVNVLANLRLLDALTQVPQPRRAVIFSSGTHDPAKRAGLPVPRHVDPARLADPDSDPEARADGAFTRGSRAYTASKAAVAMLAYALARDRPWLRIDAFDPQLTPGTGLARSQAAPIRLLWHALLPHLVPLVPFMNRPADVAAAAVQVATDPAFDGTGRYFEVRRGRPVETSSSPLTLDPSLQEALLIGARSLLTGPGVRAGPAT